MARKFFQYTTDGEDTYGASIDAELHDMLNEAGVWSNINKTGVNGTVYDTFAALNAADEDVAQELPSDIQPRMATLRLLGVSFDVILPCPPSQMVGSVGSLQDDYTIEGLVTRYQGEIDNDLQN